MLHDDRRRAAADRLRRRAAIVPDRELVIDPGIRSLDLPRRIQPRARRGHQGRRRRQRLRRRHHPVARFPDHRGRVQPHRRRSAISGDVFVTKLNAAGTALVYSTFIGGSNFDWGRGIAVDAAGNAYITGQTKSSNFPTTGGAFDRTFNVDNCPRCGIDSTTRS